MRSTIHTIITSLLIFLYVYTAVAKLITLDKNEAVLSHLPFIGSYAGVLALSIPIAELLIVVLLLVPRYNKTGLYLSLILLVIFTAYLLYMLSSGEKLPCTCGGVLEKLTWKQHVFFNLGFIVLNIVAITNRRSKQAILSSFTTHHSP